MPISEFEQQRNAGLRAFSRNDFSVAADLLQLCAEAGDIRSQILLSRMYYAGNGVPIDYEKYIYWLEKAAESGDKSARAKLKRLHK